MVRSTQAIKMLKRVAGLLAVLALMTGCKTIQSRIVKEDGVEKLVEVKPKGKPGEPVQALSTWRKQVQFGTDPVTNKPLAAISGRFYLFDKTGGHPVLGDGSVTVELFDDTNRGASAESKPIMRWNLSPEHFKQLAQPDALGDGYTITLPWPTYSPEITQVHLAVKYEPKTGSPLVANSQVMTLEHDSPEAMLAKRKLGGAKDVVQASARE